MSTTPVRVRFAPSPTGFLHIGGVRTALYNYLLAKQTGGTFILRLEDTDRERFVVEGVEQIVLALDWFGLKPDEGFWEGEETGHVGPYVQSKRLPEYEKYVQQLVDAGLAYKSVIGTAEYEDMRKAAQIAKTAFVYRRSMEPKSTNPDGKFPIRLDIEACMKHLKSRSIDWEAHDGVAQQIDPATIEDFVLLKADEFPTYNFANVVDDHLMEITHILRGNEFISSTPKHAVLFDVLGWKRPIWVHLPLIIGSDGAKLSKRHGDTDALQYRDKGYLPEAMINYLAMLGWNDGTEQEIFTADELVEKFSLDRIQKSPAKFDFERLDWMNGIYIREKLTEDEYVERATVELRSSDVLRDDTSAELIRGAVLLERERIKIFSELPDFVSFFFKRPKVTRDLLTAKLAPEVVKTMLEQSASALDGVDKNIKGHDAIEKALRDLVIEHDYKSGEVFSSIRIAITGRTTAPGLFETIDVLGVDETRTRILAAMRQLSS